MGLDMWTYKIKKANINDVNACSGKHYEEIKKMGYDIFDEPHDEEERAMLSDIMPYLQPVKIKRDEIDMEHLRKDFEIPDDAQQSGFGCSAEEITFYFRSNSFAKQIRLTDEELNKYRITVEVTAYITPELEEIQYWRKHYELQRALYDDYADSTGKSIFNCGYHILTESMRNTIIEDNEKNNPYVSADIYPESTDEEAVLYHEWY